MMPNEPTLKKIFGDPRDEGTESLYRLAATILVNATEVEGIDRLGDDNALKILLNKNEQFGEAVISFVIAAILELFPISMLDDERNRLAYNLRVRTFEKLGEALLRVTPFVAYVLDEAERSVRAARGERIEGLIDRTRRWAKDEQKKEAEAAAALLREKGADDPVRLKEDGMK
ncbi:MAG TPA: hypothetical protein VK206_27075 [Anaerolineales bacterium]|nr:hypothetical protein [Anaerolineales bacterium]HLO27792.1 hypothetical protein [Anaerolineales bacterium]